MEYAAESSQFKFAFIAFFKFTFFEPFLQLAFFFLEPLVIFKVAQFALIL